MFLKLPTGISNDAMFSILVDLCKDSSKAARLFVIFKGGIGDECIRSISVVVIDKVL
jgi:hypothetical protein